MARKYVRDNRGRFASGGGGATARGGRLKTASGNRRATQTMRATAAGGPGTIRGRTARTVAGGKVMAKLPKAASAESKPRMKRTGETMKIHRSRPPATTLQYKQAVPVTNANKPRRDRASNVMQRSVSGTVPFAEMKRLQTKVGVANNPYSNMSQTQRTKAINDLARAELQNKKASRSYRIGAKAYDMYTNLAGYTQGDGRKKWRRAGQRATSLGAGTIRRGVARRSVSPVKAAAPAVAPRRRSSRMWYEGRR